MPKAGPPPPGAVAMMSVAPTIGTSTGAVVPKEMLARLKVGKGDTLYAIQTAEGYLLTPYDPSIDGHLNTGQDFMKE
jgi:bifunctional DNA-binding transcriptional regulator/antitoxin component of YhaV-PrlF toxin-antitoxin module